MLVPLGLLCLTAVLAAGQQTLPVTLGELKQKQQEGKDPTQGLEGRKLDLGNAGTFDAHRIGKEGAAPNDVYVINGDPGNPAVRQQLDSLSERLSAEGKSALALFHQSQASGDGKQRAQDLLKGMRGLGDALGNPKFTLVDLAPKAPMNTGLAALIGENSRAQTPLGDAARAFAKSLYAMHNGEMPKGPGIPSLTVPKGFQPDGSDASLSPKSDPVAVLGGTAAAEPQATPAKEPEIVKFSDLPQERQDRILMERFPDATREQRDEVRDALARLAAAKRDDATSKALADAKKKSGLSSERIEQIEREHFKRASELLPKTQPITIARVQYPNEGKRGEFIGWAKDGKDIVEMFRIPSAGSQPFANGAPRDPAPLQQQREGLQKEIAKLEGKEGREDQIAKLKEKVAALDSRIREAQLGEVFWTNMEKSGQPAGRTGIRDGQNYKNPWINHNKYQDDMMLKAKIDPKTGAVTFGTGHNGVYDIHPGGLTSGGCHTIPSRLFPDFGKVWASNIDNTKIYDSQGILLGKTAGFFYGPYRN